MFDSLDELLRPQYTIPPATHPDLIAEREQRKSSRKADVNLLNRSQSACQTVPKPKASAAPPLRKDAPAELVNLNSNDCLISKSNNISEAEYDKNCRILQKYVIDRARNPKASLSGQNRKRSSDVISSVTARPSLKASITKHARRNRMSFPEYEPEDSNCDINASSDENDCNNDDCDIDAETSSDENDCEESEVDDDEDQHSFGVPHMPTTTKS